MTKALTIDTAAAWAGTITTIQDGDPASEATMDVVMDSIGDRLGYLKTREANSFPLSSGTTRTVSGVGTVDFSSPVNLNALTTVYGASGLLVNTGSNISISAGALLAHAGLLNLTGSMAASYALLPDANATITMVFESRVPVLTGNRTYTLPSVAALPFGVGPRYRIRVTKADNANHQALIVEPVALGLLAGLGATNPYQGWVEFVTNALGEWRVSAWGGSASAITPAV